jgi:hypothetical protein
VTTGLAAVAVTQAPRRPVDISAAMSDSLRPPSSRSLLVLLLSAAALLTGCDQLGIDSPEKIAAQKDGDGRAIGGACRHAGRAIEDCYTLYKKADRAAVFAGWRDMNDYMRENKIEVVAPVMAGKPATPADAPAGESAEPAAPPKKVAKAGAH